VTGGKCFIDGREGDLHSMGSVNTGAAAANPDTLIPPHRGDVLKSNAPTAPITTWSWWSDIFYPRTSTATRLR
jgi:hypothetical protein